MLNVLGNVFLFSSQDHVEELFLRIGGYGSLGGRLFLTSVFSMAWCLMQYCFRRL